jgi:hypothetical protein
VSVQFFMFPFYTIHFSILRLVYSLVDRDSSVGIATHYGLDGSGVVCRWGRDFPHPSRPALGPTQPFLRWVLGLFPGRSGRGVAVIMHSPSSAEVKERIELYLYSRSGPLRSVLVRTLHFMQPEGSLPCSVGTMYLVISARAC